MKERWNCNKTVKWIAAVALAAMLLVSLIAAVACNNHTHEYTSEITTQPTCSESGVETFSCECGDSYTQDVSALGHSYTALKQDGALHYNVCVRCGKAQPNAAGVAHTFVLDEQASSESTCTTQGVRVMKCACGATSETTLPLATHELVPDFDGNQHWQKCKNCDYVSERSNHKLKYVSDTDAHRGECEFCDYKTENAAHEYTPTVTREATCVAKGETTYTCVCSRSYTEPIDTIPHSYTKAVSTTANHWTECVMCGAVDPDHPKTAHTWEIVGVKQAATCTLGGTDNVKCSECDYESTQPSNKLGHDFSTVIVGESNANGHRLKCARCEDFVFVNHSSLPAESIGANTECPNGHNKAPTCGAAGHQDKICLVCNQAFHTVVPPTGQHTYSDAFVNTHGTQHWHVCTVCGGESQHENHTWTTVTQQPTCTEIGHERSVCSECGYQRSNSNIDALGHSLTETVKVAATCQHTGESTFACTRCDFSEDRVTAQLKHDWHGAYQTDANKHYRTCTMCGTRETSGGNHNWREEVVQQAEKCGDTQITRKTCTACQYYTDTETVKQHNWVSTDDGRLDPTCAQLGGHYEYCNNAGCDEPRKWVVDTQLGYADHVLEYHKAQDATLFADGNIAYHECVNCHKYFKTSNCEIELTAQEIIIAKPARVQTNSVADLLAVVEADDNYPLDTESEEYYEMTLSMFETGSGGMVFVDEAMDTVTVVFDQIENLAEIGTGDVVKLMGKLVWTSGAEVELHSARVLSVPKADGLASLYIENNVLGENNNICVTCGNDTYTGTSNNYNCLLIGDTITIGYYDYHNGSVLKSLIINGKSYTATAEGVTVEVTGDMHVEATFSSYGSQNTVTVTEINTAWGAGAQEIDPYVSYTYVNGQKENLPNRLYANSRLDISLQNANIVGVEFVFEDPTGYKAEDKLNTNVIKLDGVETNYNLEYYTQGENLRVKLSLNFTGEHDLLQYVANVQARLVSLKITYATYNQPLAN